MAQVNELANMADFWSHVMMKKMKNFNPFARYYSFHFLPLGISTAGIYSNKGKVRMYFI